MMSDDGHKELVVIVGPGRSGTSLLTELLSNLGLRSVDNVEVTGDQNPNGDFEDRDVNKLNLDVYNHLGCSPNLPVRSDFVTAPGIRPYFKRARAVINNRVNDANGKWGFKDPKTASLLPFWIRTFNVEKVTPRYVLAIREPSAVIASFVKNYAISPRLAELIWLTRICDSLRHTGGNCFIVHYEHWFGESYLELACQLVSYLKLPVTSLEEIKSVLDRTVAENLNRSQYSNEVYESPFVKRLYQSLYNCSGFEFDRTELMRVVSECESAMNAFSGWWLVAQELHKKNLRLTATKSDVDQKSLKEYIENNRQLVDLSNRYLENSEALKAQLSSASLRLNALEKEKNELLSSYKNKLKRAEALCVSSSCKIKKKDQQLEKARHSLKVTQQSYAYKIGLIIVNAIKKPGVNTLKAPFRLLKLSLMFLSGRRST
ncbi:hypothetical protein [Halomonas sp. C05BenzN]|uniref:hypothetical protein n=1 Tax=Halomonas sp. C05BenzN TaxID=3411041 RepID=UPI003B945FF9